MGKALLLLIAVVCGLVTVEDSAFAGNFEDYTKIKTYRMSDPEECNSDDVGRFQASCKYMQVLSLGGISHRHFKYKKNPLWIKLSKYEDRERWFKFAGLACGRGDTVKEAKSAAMTKAMSAVTSMVGHFEDDTFVGELEDFGLQKFDDGFKCTETKNTSDEVNDVSNLRKKMEDLYTMDENALSDSPNSKKRPANDDEEIDKNVATFIIKNEDRYSLGLRFFSKSRRNVVWPGGDRQYVLSGMETYRLTCQPSEQICFGAWRDYQTTYWGVGRGKQGCNNCCIMCGQTFSTNLSDGGADAYPQQNSNVASGDSGVMDDLVGALQLGTAVLNGMNQAGSLGSAPTYRQRNNAPAPRGPTYRQSGISGK